MVSTTLTNNPHWMKIKFVFISKFDGNCNHIKTYAPADLFYFGKLILMLFWLKF